MKLYLLYWENYGYDQYSHAVVVATHQMKLALFIPMVVAGMIGMIPLVRGVVNQKKLPQLHT